MFFFWSSLSCLSYQRHLQPNKCSVHTLFIYFSLVPGPNLHAMYAGHTAPFSTELLPFKALSELSNRLFSSATRDHILPKTFYFHQDDVDRVLYGFARQPGNPHVCMHALSGLKVGEITHGMYQSTTLSQIKRFFLSNTRTKDVVDNIISI